MTVTPPALTLITDTSRYSGDAFFDAVEQSLTGGLDAVLLREKTLSSAKLLAMASRLRELTRAHGAQLIIHSQADIAEAVDADGVHLAARDIGTIPLVRGWLNDPAKMIAASCHNAQELALAAQAGADYATLSPVFPTASHPGSACLGVDHFRRLAEQAALPVVALGGITTHNCNELDWPYMAVISAIAGAASPCDATRLLRSCD